MEGSKYQGGGRLLGGEYRCNVVSVALIKVGVREKPDIATSITASCNLKEYSVNGKKTVMLY